MPEAKSAPGAEVKKPDAQQKNDAPKAPTSPAPKAAEPPKAPDAKETTAVGKKKAEEQAKVTEPKVTAAAGDKKPAEKPKTPEPQAPSSAGTKKPEEKPKAVEPNAAPMAGEKKPEEKLNVADPKASPAVGEKKTEEKPKAIDPKTASASGPNKDGEKPAITVSGKEMKQIPIEPKPVKDTAANPKAKDTAVEPPKGVKITQIFEDRLDKPTQKDLESLPIPGEGEGFSMRLHPAYFFEFLDHPFSVNRETDDYRELFDSIKENGINEPIKARPREKGGLELISGHRRHDIAMQLNYPVPVVIVRADDDSAQIECVDGNLHRKDIPTSELARAAKMKLEAMSRKVGRRSKMDQLAAPQKRTDQLVAEEMGYSRTQLTRLVRIDSLIPELKQMVDSKKVPFNVGVELSYMNPQEQKDLVSVMKREQTVPSLAQAQRMKEESQKAAKAAQEAAKAPKPAIQIVAPKQPESAPAQGSQPAAKSDLLSYPQSTSDKAPYTPSSPVQLSPPAPAPAPALKPPAPVDEKKFASIMKNKPEPELKVIFTGAELKSYFPGQNPTVPEVKRAVFDALDLRKRMQEKQAKKQEVTNPTR
ncbi:MAG: ParB N-terminal domain-containing protein [Oscillospiraceae bacterium]|nr:ParB N-terminal domain-containing protein [Oscillospiraceae bacterium]